LSLEHVFSGHRLCERGTYLLEEVIPLGQDWRAPAWVDKSEWINQIRTFTAQAGGFQEQEDLHPNYWGQLALRSCLRQAYRSGKPVGGTCKVEKSGLDAYGNPNMAFVPNTKPDGTFVETGLYGISSGVTGIFRVAGGAPIWVHDCSAFTGGCRPITDVSDLADYSMYPAEGTILCGQQAGGGGGAFVVAGGAPIWIASFQHVNGTCPPVDQYAIDHAGEAALLDHLRYYPADGTFLVGEPQGTVLYEVIGHVAFRVTDCSALGGCGPPVPVDETAIAGAGGAGYLSHLAVDMTPHTSVEGLPSNTFWVVDHGVRRRGLASVARGTVNDASLAAYPVAPECTRVFGRAKYLKRRTPSSINLLDDLNTTAGRQRLTATFNGGEVRMRLVRLEHAVCGGRAGWKAFEGEGLAAVRETGRPRKPELEKVRFAIREEGLQNYYFEAVLVGPSGTHFAVTGGPLRKVGPRQSVVQSIR
jgi:hypothetical protein